MKEKILNFCKSLPVQLICRLILGGVFIYAGATKITHLHELARIIHNYKILPESLVYISAVIMPWVEILTGFSLIVGVYKKASASIITGMLLVFIVAISFNLMRGLNFDCGCFSTAATSGGSDPVGLLIRDLLLLIPGAIIIFFAKEDKKEITAKTVATA